MGSRINQMGRGTCYHGNAGIASAFAALADKKLKPGGVLALVLPLSAASGLSWQGLRQMLAAGYTDLTVVSIAANGKDMSFSSDTGMGECLVVARKRKNGEVPSQRARFVSLHRRPEGLAQSSAVAKNIIEIDEVRQIEDGAIRRRSSGGRRRPRWRHVDRPANGLERKLGRRPHVGLLPRAKPPTHSGPIQALAARPTNGARPTGSLAW